MDKSNEVLAPALSAKKGGAPVRNSGWSGRFALATLALVLCFSRPLYDLVRFALQSDLYSHIVLMPFVSLYLVWMKRQTLPPPSAPDYRAAVSFLGAGAFILAGYWAAVLASVEMAREDSLTLTTLSFLLFFGGVCGLFFGRQTLRAIASPLGFLLFMVPFPVFFTSLVETFLQNSSAAAAYALFKLSGTTVFYHDLVFKLPGISLEVAPACSGIHSSLALFITSLLAGYFFLRTPWKCAVLTLAVIPLAILRNGFRIFTIGELCVHISPDMINSYIHRQGGPVFFILSLVPFFILLLLLYKSDHSVPKPGSFRRN